jgi:hypothetical protein
MSAVVFLKTQRKQQSHSSTARTGYPKGCMAASDGPGIGIRLGIWCDTTKMVVYYMLAERTNKSGFAARDLNFAK